MPQLGGRLGPWLLGFGIDSSRPFRFPAQPQGQNALEKPLVRDLGQLCRFREVLSISQVRVWIRLEDEGAALVVQAQVNSRVSTQVESAICTLRDTLDTVGHRRIERSRI